MVNILLGGKVAINNNQLRLSLRVIAPHIITLPPPKAVLGTTQARTFRSPLLCQTLILPSFSSSKSDIRRKTLHYPTGPGSSDVCGTPIKTTALMLHSHSRHNGRASGSRAHIMKAATYCLSADPLTAWLMDVYLDLRCGDITSSGS